ncbi:glycosyltransferase family 2 protein [Terriglobus aquaticus]|uniref:Glycosyltransferase family 2 protein n=1 Tax=Terriglobus aquaticus TaxID=940139 RepID=A0ABW9KRN8_9BACT|nr:glycosyltransferase family 2 protein [Terriglobus aquaticus]
MLLALSLLCSGCAALPAVLTIVNLREYQPPPPVPKGGKRRAVAVCIPARNEEGGIAACVESVLRSELVLLEVVVADDHSTDRTAAIVQAISQRDSRVRLLEAPTLPAGWNGKQHACWIAAQNVLNGAAIETANGGSRAEVPDAPLLCFLDADVRLEPAALDRMAALLHDTGAALVSGFPQEETGMPMEWLLLPLIHFVLLGYLPLWLLRLYNSPGFAAGCGQFLLVEPESYVRSGGHSAIRHTMHDGLLLPRLLRQHGYGTRLADLTGLARCRMYHSAAATWRGLAKNATEGMAAPAAILPFTFLLGFGAVLPVPLLIVALTAKTASTSAVLFAWAAVVLSYLPRLLEVRRFRQRGVSAALHPVGVATLLVLQWYAFVRKLIGRPAAWKDRAYQAN